MKRLLIASMVVFGLLSSSSTDAATTWHRVGTHPEASAQPTTRGKTLHDLHAYGGRIYVGYGDYSANTGPIAHRPWNASTGQWELEDSQDTEEVNNYQSFAGILWSPSIDPALGVSASNASDYANLNGLRQWPDSDKFASWHVFDIRALGSSLIASGSDFGCSVSCAEIWRSDNGGASWYEWLRDDTDATGVWGGHRCYHLATWGNRAWANCTTGAKTSTGSAWVADSTQQYGHKESTTFAGTLVTPARGALRAFDGAERLLRAGTHRFVAVDGATLYAVDLAGGIFSTTDLSSWSSVGTLPLTATSFTAAGGVLYYGDAASTLYATRAPTPSSTTTVASTTTTTALTTTTTTTWAPKPPRRCFLGLFCN